MKPRDLAELVRLPAALTVPGDTLAGAAAAGWPLGRRAWALPAASVCLYWAGMALNDYADRELDALERPERPIPSGRITPRQAVGIAGGLTVAGLVAAAAAGGRRAMQVAAPLAVTVWAYDLALKQTSLGPAAMAAARGLDVLLGAGGHRAAALPAVAVAGHTAGVTALSRGEVHGTSRAVAAGALATTLGVATLTVLPVKRGMAATAAGVLAATYAVTVGRAQAAAMDRPDGSTARRATGAGIRGLIPLQAALIARAGALGLAGALMAAGPIAKLASKVVSPT
ncbi:MAG TPA: UbiA family prenyltransferase [Jiangellaceae bacterium]|nr:UbiA family prenyltransferase [Jiangellaceae bacterium]